jgi:uncharacterized protein
MKNIVSIVEIPTSNFSRAVTFYQKILDITIEAVDMEGIQMGLFPSNDQSVSVSIIRGDDYKPSTDGALVYFNAGNDLQSTLERVEQQGGKIVVPKTEISPDIGFFAMFLDTEGNKLGLHSKN